MQYVFSTLARVRVQREMAEGGIVKFSPIEIVSTVAHIASDLLLFQWRYATIMLLFSRLLFTCDSTLRRDE